MDTAFELPVSRAAGPQSLPPEQLHVWRVRHVPGAAWDGASSSILSVHERERLHRVAREPDRQSYLEAHVAARELMGLYLDVEPGDVILRYETGKPAVVMGAARGIGLQFNLARTSKLSLLAFRRGGAIGIDVEAVTTAFDTEAITARFFASEEKERLAALAPEERALAFMRCFTAKEAYGKALGCGLRMALDSFVAPFSSTPPDSAAQPRCAGDFGEGGWSLYEFDPAPGLVASVVTQGPIDVCRVGDWSDSISNPGGMDP